MHEFSLSLDDIHTLTNNIFARKKISCNFCFSAHFLLNLKKLKFINLMIGILFNHLYLGLLQKYIFIQYNKRIS